MTYDKWKTDPDDIKDRFERGEDEREELYADLERLRSINADLLAAAKESIALADANCVILPDGTPNRTEECQAIYDRTVAAITRVEAI